MQRASAASCSASWWLPARSSSGTRHSRQWKSSCWSNGCCSICRGQPPPVPQAAATVAAPVRCPPAAVREGSSCLPTQHARLQQPSWSSSHTACIKRQCLRQLLVLCQGLSLLCQKSRRYVAQTVWLPHCGRQTWSVCNGSKWSRRLLHSVRRQNSCVGGSRLRRGSWQG